MTDADPIGYSTAPARPRNGVLLGVLWGLLAIQVALFALSYYRPSRTALAFPAFTSGTAFNRMGIQEGLWVIARADLNRPPASGPTQSPTEGNPLPGVRYVIAPAYGLRWAVGVSALWTIVPTLLAALWQTRKRYRGR